MTRRRTSYTLLPEIESQTRNDNRTFTATIYAFFAALSRWKVAECHPSGIAVEIIATARSYWQVMARRIRHHKSATTIYCDQLHSRRPRAIELSPLQWHRLLWAADLNLHMKISLDQDLSALPMVQVVSKLFIKRRTVRSFSMPTLTEIIKCFPRLDTVDFEVRQQFHWWYNNLEDQHYVSLLPQ